MTLHDRKQTIVSMDKIFSVFEENGYLKIDSIHGLKARIIKNHDQTNM